MTTSELFTKALIIIAASFVSAAVLTRMRLPPAAGYLAAGLIIGQHGLGWVDAGEETRFLAELGVIFLMFTVGLELSLPGMMAARSVVFGAGGLQVGLTVLFVGGGAALVGFDLHAAALLGGAAAMSSTALALKQLADQHEINTDHGRRAVGILVFQDLATLPFLALLGAWTTAGAPEPGRALVQILIAAATLAAALVIARPAFHRALEGFARAKSPEVFLLGVLLLALGMAFGVHLVGLAAPIGAFIVGLAIGESDFRRQVEDDIRPFRDVLVGLFFVTVGMEVNPAIVLSAPLTVLTWLFVFLIAKALTIGLVSVVLKWPLPIGMRVSIILAHGGEFGLLILTQALLVGALDPATAQPALLALAATMFVAPMLIQHNGWITRKIVGAGHSLASAATVAPTSAEDQLIDHIVLCGYGRIGRLVAIVLAQAKIRYVIVESDHSRYRAAQKDGHLAIFGDASRESVLRAAGVERAKAVVATFDHRQALDRLLSRARQANADLALIVSATDDRQLSEIAKAGATIVFPENIAAGLTLADQILVICGFSQEQAAHIVTTVRATIHPELAGFVGR